MADEELRRIFARNLNKYLALNGYRQADLARHMKVSTATTAKWCTGQVIPRIDKIQSICNWLCIKKEDLLNENDIRDEEYYLNKDARAYAEFLRDNPGHRVLFDATRKVRAEDVDLIRQMLERIGINDNLNPHKKRQKPRISCISFRSWCISWCKIKKEPGNLAGPR